jgi:hypothetical protein
VSGFGDDEPEDAWDRDDDPADQVANLERRAALLEPGAAPAGSLAVRLDAVEDVLERASRRRLDEHDTERWRELAEDVAFMRGRV